MSLRKGLAKSFRSGVSGIVLCGSIISAPIIGAVSTYMNVVPSFDEETTAVSQEHYKGYSTRADELDDLHEEWHILAKGAEEQDSPDKVREFLAEKKKVKAEFYQKAEKLSAEILTNPDLSEIDYRKIEEDFVSFENAVNDNDSFFLPNEHRAFKESQITLSADADLNEKFRAAQQIRTEMKGSADPSIGIILVPFSLFFTVGMASIVGSTRPNRKIADALEKGTKKPTVRRN